MIFSVQIAKIQKKIHQNWLNLDHTCKKKRTFESKTAKMRKCLTKFSRIFECGAVAPSGHMLRITGIYFLTQCGPYSHCQSSVHFATPLGLAASLRPDGFFSGAVCFVRRTLARSVLLLFQIGVQRCKIMQKCVGSCRSQELSIQTSI